MKTDESNWVCPNDRQLLLRAKLRAGWSNRAQNTGSNGSKGNIESITPEELKHIQTIISRAELMERVEQERIGFLVQQLEIMVQKSEGDGVTCCLLCSEKFGKFSRTTSIVCTECRKKVCEKCCIDYTSGKNLQDMKQQLNQQSVLARLWLCKICSENKEVWKRSGAWFFNALPRHILPSEPEQDDQNTTYAINHTIIAKPPMNSSKNLLSINEPMHTHHRTLSGHSVTSFQWSKPTARRESSSEDEEEESSDDDDGIMLGKQTKSNASFPTNTDKKLPEIELTVSKAVDSDDSQTSSNASVRRQGSFKSKNVPSSNIQTTNEIPLRHFPYQTQTDSVAKEQDVVSIDSRVTDMSNEDSVENPSAQSEDTNSVTSEQYSKSALDLRADGSRGYLDFSLLYDPIKCALHVTINKAKDLPSKDANGFSDPYVKLHLLPGSNRATKLRTKTKWKTLNPLFNERLSYYGILEDEMPNRTLRLTVLDEDRFGQNEFIGEVRIPLNLLTVAQSKGFNVPLQHMQMVDKCERAATDPGRLQLGLKFSTKENALIVTVIRCANLIAKNPNDACSSFVKVSLQLDAGQAITAKTSIKRKNANPEFNKELKFRASGEKGHAEVARGSLIITVLEPSRPGSKQHIIGCINLGINSEAGKLRHWFNCLKNPDKLFEEWHILEEQKNG